MHAQRYAVVQLSWLLCVNNFVVCIEWLEGRTIVYTATLRKGGSGAGAHTIYTLRNLSTSLSPYPTYPCRGIYSHNLQKKSQTQVGNSNLKMKQEITFRFNLRLRFTAQHFSLDAQFKLKFEHCHHIGVCTDRPGRTSTAATHCVLFCIYILGLRVAVSYLQYIPVSFRSLQYTTTR